MICKDVEMLSRCQCLILSVLWCHPPLQDKDLKQYMDDCGNIMSMHNVKVRTTCTNIYTVYSAVSLQIISFLFCIFIFIPSQDNEDKLDHVDKVLSPRDAIFARNITYYVCLDLPVPNFTGPVVLSQEESSPQGPEASEPPHQ